MMFEQVLQVLQDNSNSIIGLETTLLLLLIRMTYTSLKSLANLEHEFKHLLEAIDNINKNIVSTEEYSKDTYKILSRTSQNHLVYKDGNIIKVY